MNLPKIKKIAPILTLLNSNTGLLFYSLIICGAIFFIQLTLNITRNGIGFPLDDSWIHQTYARSLATGNGWAYGINPPSAGSTSILWTLLLVPGYWFGEHGFYIWTMGVSFIVFTALIFTSMKLFQRLASPGNSSLLFLGIILALDWHLIWASGSGMETLFSALGYGAAYLILLSTKPKFFLAGLVTGTLVLIRPDGITMIGPLIVILAWKIFQKQGRWYSAIWMLSGFLLPLIPMVVHNLSLAGSFFPNTYDAKYYEYAVTQTLPFFVRFGRLISVFITGVGVLLFPGFLFSGYKSVRNRDIWSLCLYTWFLGFVLIYVFRLPVNYQHGRYLIPLIPLFTIMGTWGTVEFMKNWRYRAAIISMIGILSIAFAYIGVNEYINNVATINNLMIRPAQWIRDETPTGSIIAAHDIGALGYFGNRRIIDLAGLIDPEVIPFIRDEKRLQDYISIRNADYLLVFSNWYQFTQGLTPEVSFVFGEDNLQRQVDIYQLK